MKRYLTVPNGLTFLRAAGIPLFLWLVLSKHADGWAIVVLAIGGATDYFDGKLARAWNQTSKFGEIADPTIDRLYIIATLIAFYLRDVLPVWVLAILILRDLAMAGLALKLQVDGFLPLKVTYLGKAATFNLLYAFPLLLLAQKAGAVGTVAFIFGWAFAMWGIVLYLGTAVGYYRTAWQTVRVRPRTISIQ